MVIMMTVTIAYCNMYELFFLNEYILIFSVYSSSNHCQTQIARFLYYKFFNTLSINTVRDKITASFM